MQQIFWGMFFVFLDFNLNLGKMSIGLTPDFVGMIFFWHGVGALAEQSVYFVKARPISGIGIGYCAFLYILDLFGLGSIGGSLVSILLSLCNYALTVYLTYLCIAGIRDMERIKGCDFGSAFLYKMWLCVVIIGALTYPLIFAPFLAFLCMLAGIVMTILLLVAMYQVKKRVEQNGNQIHLSM